MVSFRPHTFYFTTVNVIDVSGYEQFKNCKRCGASCLLNKPSINCSAREMVNNLLISALQTRPYGDGTRYSSSDSAGLWSCRFWLLPIHCICVASTFFSAKFRSNSTLTNLCKVTHLFRWKTISAGSPTLPTRLHARPEGVTVNKHMPRFLLAR